MRRKINHYRILRCWSDVVNTLYRQNYEVSQKKNNRSKAMMKQYPGQGIEDLFCDLQIIGPLCQQQKF
jgi:hypothetical protein